MSVGPPLPPQIDYPTSSDHRLKSGLATPKPNNTETPDRMHALQHSDLVNILQGGKDGKNAAGPSYPEVSSSSLLPMELRNQVPHVQQSQLQIRSLPTEAYTARPLSRLQLLEYQRPQASALSRPAAKHASVTC